MSRMLSWLPVLALAAAALILGALGASHHWDERDSNILFFAAWCAAILLLFVFGLWLPPRIPGSRFRAMLFNVALAVGAIVVACLANVAIFRHDVFLDLSREAANTPYRIQLIPRSSGLKRTVKELTVWVDDEARIQRTETTLPKGDRLVTIYKNQRPAPLPASTFDFTPPADAHISQPLGK